MIAPANGDPAATPSVRAVACRPIASPLTAPGARLLASSTVEERDGAQSRPEGMSARHSHHQPPPTRPSGTVVMHSPAASHSGDTPRLSPPYTKPPIIEHRHHRPMTAPVQLNAPLSVSVATIASSVAVSTKGTAKVAHNNTIIPGSHLRRGTLVCPAASSSVDRVGGFSLNRTAPAAVSPHATRAIIRPLPKAVTPTDATAGPTM